MNPSNSDPDGFLLLEYRPSAVVHQAREFARRHRLISSAITLLLLAGFLGPALFIALVNFWLQAKVRSAAPLAYAGQGGTDFGLGALVTGMATATMTAPLLLGLAVIYVASRMLGRTPTHLAITDRELKLVRGDARKQTDLTVVPWESIERAYLKRHGSRNRGSDARLCLTRATGMPLTLKIGAIPRARDRQELLAALSRKLPAGSVNAAVVEALEPPAVEKSFTELWLQELSGPSELSSLTPLAAGAVLQEGQYRIISQIGMGGQATVYLAAVRSIGDEAEQVVLKEFVLPVFQSSRIRQKAAAQFQREAEVLCKLHHPAIVTLLDVFVENHRAYLVMERIPGATLQSLVERSGALEESRVLALARQMCEILRYLHSQVPPLVHRDFTPDNLIVDEQGSLKLIDFSVAQQSETHITGTVVGKFAYMAPEQFQGNATTQSDIYALGATLHFLLTGSLPEAAACSHPRSLRREITEKTDAIVARATAVQWSDRYATVEELMAELG
jgi:tRNA A-37 threonylcarbamoyl transferase component Bud32